VNLAAQLVRTIHNTCKVRGSNLGYHKKLNSIISLRIAQNKYFDDIL